MAATTPVLPVAGFFPADNPRYTCIVCIKKSGLPASGGGMSGVVFHHIAEGVMAQNLKLSVADARDSSSVFKPAVKQGNNTAADYVLTGLNIKERPQLQQEKTSDHTIPNLTGMGARDAVYALEKRGVKAIIRGRGKVKSQSLYAGTDVKQGMKCEIYLE